LRAIKHAECRIRGAATHGDRHDHRQRYGPTAAGISSLRLSIVP
jgi:hypothetical protein